MLTYTKAPDSNVAEIVVDGKISDEEMNAAITAMKADLDKGGKLKLLEDIRAFQGMEPAAFFKDPRFGISMMKGVSHVALVTDAPWLRMMAETFAFVSPYQIKCFERTRLDEARSWLAAAN
ncbi:STAS/SEC14 domain-containing protein [Methylobacterium sp. NEAU 140]|uniref:STAS/SEC14 domain-containing protein n=1 Tax=Methylobacterium sp. NEAU 140 TaxID=3064945 RepID=UPI00273578E2|nr:STAS/SEC14 domain-containing protein [Methylobacterium sp. NEAU 140]MDP4024529.1 STAS/SEC14 domain-containing protein [Methylobacterium sp. NEAU 140]